MVLELLLDMPGRKGKSVLETCELELPVGPDGTRGGPADGPARGPEGVKSREL